MNDVEFTQELSKYLSLQLGDVFVSPYEPEAKEGDLWVSYEKGFK